MKLSSPGALALVFTVMAQVASAVPIQTIVVENNSKTTAGTVVSISGLEPGTELTPDLLATARDYLISSGLFREVDVSYEPVDGGAKVIISAVDKHSWVIAPTYYNQPTNTGGGLGFGENNLFGENKKLLLYGQVATGSSFFIGAYVDPSVQNTRFRWQADVYLLRGRIIEYAPPDGYLSDPMPVRTSWLSYLNAGVRGGLAMARGATMDVRLRAAKVFYQGTRLVHGAALADVLRVPAGGSARVPDPGGEGYDVSAELRLEYDGRTNWYGLRDGERYRLNLERSLVDLGADFDYWLATFRVERARRYFRRHNLVISSMLGFGKNLPFQQEYTGGGTGLRGYKNAQFRGNLKLAATLEYSLPLVTARGVALRLLGFWDSSYVGFVDTSGPSAMRNYLPGHDELGLAPFKNTIGIGTRIYVRQIVLPLLGLDLGYGLERRDFEIYLAIGLTDL